MKIISGTSWDYLGVADAICFLSHGHVNAKGESPMGSGTGVAAKTRYPALPKLLGAQVAGGGNHVNMLLSDRRAKPINSFIVSFPTRNFWRDKLDRDVITTSAKELVHLADTYKWQTVVVPRPTCDGKGMEWRDVEHILAPILDHRFTITDETGGDI